MLVESSLHKLPEVMELELSTQVAVTATAAAGTLSIRKCDVPKHLQAGNFFRSLHGDDDGEKIDVPSNVLKSTTTVQSHEDLADLLSSARYWMVTEPFEDVMSYVLSTKTQDSVLEVIAPFEQNFPYLSDLRVLRVGSGGHNDSPLIYQAVQLGSVEIVKFLFSQGLRCSDKTLLLAAQHGNLECLQLMIEAGVRRTGIAFNAAIEHGHIGCVKYLHSVGKTSAILTAVKAACLFNQLEILTFLHETGYQWHRQCLLAAAEAGSLDCLQYALQHSGLPLTPPVISDAAKAGHVHIVEYLLQQHCPTDESLLIEVIRGGQLAVLVLLHRSGFELNASVFGNAVQFGRVEMLRYLVQYDSPRDARAMAVAAVHGQVGCAEYLREIGFAWGADTMCLAIYNCNIEMVKYLHAHGCPWSTKCYQLAIARNQAEMMLFLRENTGDEMISFAQYCQKLK